MSDQKKKISRRELLVGVPAVLSGSCGGDEHDEESLPAVNFVPAGPGTVVEEELTVTCAETRVPVPGATVWGPFEGDFTTNDEGKVTVRVGEGYPLEVKAEGYLKRETRFAKNRNSISLWPIVAQDDAYFRELLYFKGELRSLQTSLVRVEYRDGISDHRIIVAHEHAITRIEEVFNGQVRFRTRSPAAQAVFAVSVNPSDPEFVRNPMWGGYTQLSLSNGAIKGATIVYREVQWAIALAQHELGHCLGLGHASGSDWMMNPSGYHLASDFNETEKRALRFSLVRQPGWQPLDSDRDLPSVRSAATDPESRLIGC